MLHRLLCFILLFSTGNSFAQQSACPSLEAQVRFTKVNLYEEIEVTFVFYNGEISQFEKPDFGELKLLRGPMQSTSRSMTTEHGVEVTRQKMSMAYMLKAKHKGIYEIGKAKAKAADGETYYSQPVRIEVVDNSEEIERTANYPMLEKEMTDFAVRAFDEKTPYIVATGPLFYHSGMAPKRTPGALVREVKAAIGNSEGLQEMGVYIWDSTKPRIYLGMKDTNHIQEKLARLYARYGDGQYYTKIATIGTFMFGENAGTLRSVRDYYLGFEHMKPWLISQGRDTVQPRKLHYTWIFSRKTGRDAFNNLVAQKGYAIDSLARQAMGYDKSVTFYSVTISQTVNLEDKELGRKADELLEIAESLGATFAGMTVERDK